MRKALQTFGALMRSIGVVLVIASVVTELRKPAAKRTWHGHVFKVVPYDFRRPTLARIKASLWNPHDKHILTERVLGVGWGVNFYRLFSLAQRSFA